MGGRCAHTLPPKDDGRHVPAIPRNALNLAWGRGPFSFSPIRLQCFRGSRIFARGGDMTQDPESLGGVSTMSTDHVNAHAWGGEGQASHPLARKFRRLSIWLGALAGLAALLTFLLRGGTPWDITTISRGCLLALVVGLLFWAITRGVAMLALGYLQGTRFQKAYILVAGLSGIGTLAIGAYQDGWRGAAVGLVWGVLMCVFVLAAASVIEWVVSGFRRGQGYRRLAVVLAILLGLVILGCILGAGNAVGVGAMTTVAWWSCGLDLRREMGLRLMASRVGWFAGITVWLILSVAMPHGKDHASLSEGFPWTIGLALVTGVAARLITLFVGTVAGHDT